MPNLVKNQNIFNSFLMKILISDWSHIVVKSPFNLYVNSVVLHFFIIHSQVLRISTRKLHANIKTEKET